MDSDVAASVARARRRNSAMKDSSQVDENRFEQENKAFFTRVRNKYMEIAKREPQRVLTVDARRPPDVVHPEILNIVRNRLLEVAVDANGRVGD
jgi:dTMP kinase